MTVSQETMKMICIRGSKVRDRSGDTAGSHSGRGIIVSNKKVMDKFHLNILFPSFNRDESSLGWTVSILWTFSDVEESLLSRFSNALLEIPDLTLIELILSASILYRTVCIDRPGTMFSMVLRIPES